MEDLIFGKVINVKAAADGPSVGAKIEIFIQSQHMPVDMIQYFGRDVTIRDQVKKLQPETELERSAREQRERDDARRFEGLADVPQDKTDPETCEFCLSGEGLVDETNSETCWACKHPDGKPEQPTDLGAAWSCKNFSRRVVVVDAEDPVEICKGDNCTCFINLDPEHGTAAACAWEEEEIELSISDQGGIWLKHEACLEATKKAIEELPAALEEAQTQQETPTPLFVEERDIICDACAVNVDTLGAIESGEVFCAWCGAEHATILVDSRLKPGKEGTEPPEEERPKKKAKKGKAEARV